MDDSRLGNIGLTRTDSVSFFIADLERSLFRTWLENLAHLYSTSLRMSNKGLFTLRCCCRSTQDLRRQGNVAFNDAVTRTACASTIRYRRPAKTRAWQCIA